MHAWVYKSVRKENTYLYITSKDGFDRVPGALLELLGDLKLVIDIELDSERKLAQADVKIVLTQLKTTGFFLQMPLGDQNPQKLC